ncbi:uncharacterized protein SOCG_05785 [Schizosaccharomyces octosporus yFS286]|uniref:Uncharacterized protein n=1 Tax=Schizosaccharomyces octosporus (strain yFS286) TaxID=483514 RepID=S9R4A8_SCHOY|nr:uncharacterized protein SOCG_05785 [Schizosaccharomyces octosporus yFS286]EPX73175.1 hypothetical protein SOCG_05785 [Schizosaccharomyces octosporus yFS286]
MCQVIQIDQFERSTLLLPFFFFSFHLRISFFIVLSSSLLFFLLCSPLLFLTLSTYLVFYIHNLHQQNMRQTDHDIQRTFLLSLFIRYFSLYGFS